MKKTKKLWYKILCFCGFHDWRRFNRGQDRMKQCKRCGIKTYDWFRCPYAPSDTPAFCAHCHAVSCKQCGVYKAIHAGKKCKK